MKEYYFSRKNGKNEKRTFFVIRYENNSWGNESETNIKYPNLSRDGNIIHRGNKYRERTDTGWSELKSLGPPFTDIHIMGISVSDKETYFFDQWDGKDTIGAISYSRLINGKYEPRQKMGKEINRGTRIAHPKIAPDDSCLTWDHQGESGYGQADIYISFRQKDGSWLSAINIGIIPVNGMKGKSNNSLTFRVDNFNGYLHNLKSNGIFSLQTMEDNEGKIAFFNDPENNKIGLWGA
jgi:hypothetical protein